MTNKEWHYYDEYGSYYRLIDNELWFSPGWANHDKTDEEMEEDAGVVNYDCLDMPEVFECKKIEQELALKELV